MIIIVILSTQSSNANSKVFKSTDVDNYYDLFWNVFRLIMHVMLNVEFIRHIFNHRFI